MTRCILPQPSTFATLRKGGPCPRASEPVGTHHAQPFAVKLHPAEGSIARASPASSRAVEWQPLVGRSCCPICGSSDGSCSRNLEESFVACSHVPSDWVLTNRAWLHAPASPTNDAEEPLLVESRA